MPIRGMILWASAALLATASGCAQWSSPPPSKDLAWLPRPQLASDSVVFEVTFIRVPEEQKDFTDSFWPEVDEGIVAVPARRHLAANGFRCGLVGAAVPSVLQEVLDRQPAVEPGQGTQMVEPGREVVARTHRLRSQAGQPAKIVVRTTPLDKLAVLVNHEDGRVSGESLRQAQLLFSISSFPLGDGQVQLELTPTIEHGQSRFRFRGENGAWMVDNTSRDIRMFDDMKVAAHLSAGEALVVTCTVDERGLGNQFFGDDPAEKISRLLLLVRLQQTQKDARFEHQEMVEPVASIWN